MGEKIAAVGKTERRRPLGRPTHRWIDNIKFDLVETGWVSVDWIGLTQDRNQRWTFGFHKMLGNS
jgi:hypothetical protein